MDTWREDEGSEPITLVMTCGACPEQYDVMRGEETVGYLRLRHGHFTANLWGPSGPQVYQAKTIGDGIFDETERDEQLAAALTALAAAGGWEEN